MASAMRIWEYATAALFGLAIISKALDPMGTLRLFTWMGLSPIGAWGALSLLALLEVSIVALLLLVSGTRARILALVTLGLFSLFLVYLTTAANAPGCGCGSLLSSAIPGRDGGPAEGLARNATFLVGFAIAALWDSLKRAVAARTP